MKRLSAIMLTAMMVLFATAMAVSAVSTLEVRSAVAGESVNGIDNIGTGTTTAPYTGTFTWDSSNFAGLYYDLKKDIMTETLTFSLTGGDKLSGDSADRGIAYTTTPKKKAFKFADFGNYYVIGFLAEKYFANYPKNSFLANKSDDDDALANSRLFQVLMDDNTEKTFTSGTPLKLADGYQLAISGIDVDGNKAYVELTKNGEPKDSAIVQPSRAGATIDDKTYIYKPDIAGLKKFTLIAVHFKNAFKGDTAVATIDGVWQISDAPKDVSTNQKFDKMTITESKSDIIKMENKDNDITLSKNKDESLMPGIRVKTADNDTLRFYVYKLIDQPGPYEIRGAVAGKSVNGIDNIGTATATAPYTGTFTWDSSNFAGLYYDLKKDIMTETLSFSLTNGDKLSGDSADRGIAYTTAPKKKAFKFADFGNYYVIGFLAERYFANYPKNSFLANKSDDDDALANSRLFQVLMDDNTEKTFTSGTPLELADGYQLAISGIDVDGNKAYVELTKNGEPKDSAIVQPSREGATIDDKTYIYKPDIAGLKKFTLIAVHFKNAFKGDKAVATIDGVWQISDAPKDVSTNQKFDKMTITESKSDMIKMENKDNDITLSKNKDESLMPGIRVKTADNDTLRFYVYKSATIEAENVTPPAAPAAPTVPVAAAAEGAKVTTEVKGAAENVTKEAGAAAAGAVAGAEGAAKGAVNDSAEKAKEAAGAAAAPAKQPGFEGIFAITGLLAIAYLVLGRKQ